VLQMNSIRKLKKISRIGLKQIRKNKIEDTGERIRGRRRIEKNKINHIFLYFL